MVVERGGGFARASGLADACRRSADSEDWPSTVAKKRILYVFPTAWDVRQLAACREAWEPRFEVVLGEPSDEETPDSFDALAYVERMAAEHRGRIDGVTSSSDYPGATVAAAIAARLGLPGPGPERVLRCSHKLTSRRIQREAAPEAVPAFHAVRHDAGRAEDVPLEFPCFLKPVKGAFSQHARRIASRDELAAFLARPLVADFCERYLAIFNDLVRALTDFETDGRWFIAEGLLVGEQVTVEGYTSGGQVEVLGVVDSAMHPGTNSFVRFDHPSRHPPERVERMRALARRVMAHMGLESSLFNIELMVDPATERLSILEINPRICGQFGDLYAKVSGLSSFEVQLQLAAGERPEFRRFSGPFAVAASYPLRTFRPVRIARVPDASDLEAVQARWPDVQVWVECHAGQVLSDFEAHEDGQSARYAVLNLGAASAEELEYKRAQVLERLGFELESL